MCEGKYSGAGLQVLSPRLNALLDFPFTPKEQIQLAAQCAAKLSIQGVQPKLSLKLNIAKYLFEVVEIGGDFILKPPHQMYDEVPENEDVTMRLALLAGIEVPFHGMIYNIDGSRSYIIKRFDRRGKNHKVGVEDFAQLLGLSRETKYDSSMEKMSSVIDKHCTFPVLEKIKFFRRVLFNFLVGNEDMHVKNYTLIRRDSKVELSPAYDLLNTTVLLQSKEEIALPIRGKKSKLTRVDLVEYFGLERLGLSEAVVERELFALEQVIPRWKQLLMNSFLSLKFQRSYEDIIDMRWQKLRK